MEKDLIYRKLRFLLENELSEKKYEEIIAGESKLNDAISLKYGETIQERELQTKGWNTKEGYFFNALGHISANPSDPIRKDLIINTYVFPDTEDGIQSDYINYNEKSINSFLEKIINSSRSEFNLYTSKAKTNRNVFFVYGSRGIGKTIFINYFLTRFNEFLNENKIIWIRLNLSDEFGVKPNLIHWLQSKVVMVVLKYYYKKFNSLKNIVINVKERLNKSISNIEERNRYIDNINKLELLFAEKRGGEVLSPDLINGYVATLFHDEIIKTGYSFIFILDNLDKLEDTEKYRKKSTQLFLELQRITDSDTRLGGCYILISRPETKEFLSNHKHSPLRGFTPEDGQIKEVSFDRIIEKRLNFLEKNQSIMRKLQWSQFDWKQHINNFRSYVILLANKANFVEFISHINGIYGSNNRVKAQLLQLFYHNFLNKYKHVFFYKLIEHMCLAGFKHVPKIYHYEKKKNEIVMKFQSKVFDNIFLNTIFSYPYCKDYNFSTPVAKTHILSGLRILQVLFSYRNIREDENYHLPLSTLISILKEKYGYDSFIIKFLLEEFFDFGLVSFPLGNFLSPKTNDSRYVELTSKAEVLFNFNKNDFYKGIMLNNKVIIDVAYLNLCAQRCLLSEFSLSQVTPFINACTLEEENIVDWTNWKILNSISLLRLIIQIDKKESVYKLDLFSDQNDRNSQIISSINLNTKEIKEAVLNQCMSIVSHMQESQTDKLFQLLLEYELKWT